MHDAANDFVNWLASDPRVVVVCFALEVIAALAFLVALST